MESRDAMGLEQRINPVFRSLILRSTTNPAAASFVRENGMRLGAARFVAGETFDDALPVHQRLNAAGFATNTTLLGEALHDERAVADVLARYIQVQDRITAAGLNTNIAVKLTQLGLTLNEDDACSNVDQLVSHAASQGAFIRIDMEESAHVNATLRIFDFLRRRAGYTNVGTVLQSALLRTDADLVALTRFEPNLRLVKGAYLENEHVAYQQKRDVDRNYVTLAERMLTRIPFTAIATHDEAIIDHLITFAKRRAIPQERFEFQMLYGIRPQLQRRLQERGYPVRIATPFGPEWYFYLMRRLAEHPANALFLARGVLAR